MDCSAAEAPVPFAFILFHWRQAKEFVHSLLRVVHLHLLRIVIFVFDSNVARFVIFVVFVFKVITGFRKVSLA